LRFERHIAVAYLAGLREIAAAARPSLIHIECEPWQGVAVQSVRLARRLDIPVGIQFAENGPQLRGTGGALRHAVGARVLRRCDYAVGWSSESTRIAEHWAPGIRTDTFPGTGISLDEHVAETDDRWFGNDGSAFPKLAFVGRFDDEKGVTDFLEVCDQLASRLPIRVALAGDGDDRKVVERWSATRPWAFVHGVLPRPEAQSLLAAADVLVSCSLSRRSVKEQFGKAAAEAMAAGTPVFSYDSGALPEVIGDGGVVVPEGSIDQLVAALERYFTGPARERAALEANAKTQAAQFTDEAIASRLLRLWSSL
jgi:glycosyltransferase involved in cell wall biosynthesis